MSQVLKTVILVVLFACTTAIFAVAFSAVFPTWLLTYLGVCESVFLLLQLVDWRLQDIAISTPANIVNAIVRLETGPASSATINSSAIEIKSRKKSECLMNVRKALRFVGFSASAALMAILFCRILSHVSHPFSMAPMPPANARMVVNDGSSKGMATDTDEASVSVNHSTRSGGAL